MFSLRIFKIKKDVAKETGKSSLSINEFVMTIRLVFMLNQRHQIGKNHNVLSGYYLCLSEAYLSVLERSFSASVVKELLLEDYSSFNFVKWKHIYRNSCQ